MFSNLGSPFPVVSSASWLPGVTSASFSESAIAMAQETAYFHVNDPLENLCLRVTVRESSRVATGTASVKKQAPFGFDKDVAWQEKIVGPRDVVKRLSKKDANVKDDLLKPVMLYTYVDKDHFWTENLPGVHDMKVEESYLGAAMFSQTSDDVTTTARAREVKVQKRVTREKPFKSMHICLATDVDVDALQSSDLFGHGKKVSAHMTEHVLCSIRLYGDGLMEVYPNFSAPSAETGGGVSLGAGGALERAGLSAFLDDGTVQAAVGKGFRLMSHRVQSKSGVEYEYVVHNVNDVLSPLDLDEALARQRLLDMKAAAASRSANDAANWKQDPPSKGFHKSVALYAEIVSAKDFYGRQLFVNYQVQLPQGWDLRTGAPPPFHTHTHTYTHVHIHAPSMHLYVRARHDLRTGNLSDGMAEKDVAEAISVVVSARSRDGGGGGGGASSGSEVELEGQEVVPDLALDGYADGLDAQGMLYGTTHTARAADLRWLPSRERRAWRAPFVSFAYPSQGTRFLLGLAFFFTTVVAVILGEPYPFWIVPALGIVFIVGTGYPGGTTILVLSDSKNNISKGSTATGKKKTPAPSAPTHRGGDASTLRRETGAGLFPSVAHFNHLINLSFDVRDMDPALQLQLQATSLGVAARAPTMHFQVYSVGWMDRYAFGPPGGAIQC